VARPSPGVARVVAVLDFLAEHPEEVFSLSELCRHVDLNKATAHSLLAELTDAGYLVRDPVEKTYALGPRLLAIGLAAARNERAVVNRARRHLRRLATELDVRCVASTLRGDEIVILDVAGRDRPFQLSIQPGNRVPCVPPVGTVFMAWATESEVERWLARADDDLTQADRDGYLAALAAVRRRSCSLSLDGGARTRLERAMIGDETGPIVDAVHDLGQEAYLLVDLDPDRPYELSHLAAPVFGADGQVVLALTIYDLPTTSSGTDVEALIERLHAAAGAVTASVGGVGLEPEGRLVARVAETAGDDSAGTT
jgi:DNA-binding IclR family transcriptional regulator